MDTIEDYLTHQKNHYAREDYKSRKEFAYKILKDAIKHADLDRNAPISEIGLSKILGISRTPIREALLQLSHEDLVETIQGRAVKIADLSLDEVLDAVQVRSILEPEVAQLVAQSITVNQTRELWNIYHEMESALQNKNRTAWKRADSHFHEYLCEICSNKLLGKMALQSRDRVSYLSASSNVTQERLSDCTLEHKVIIEAITSRNPELAGKEFRDHIKLLHESIFRRFSPNFIVEEVIAIS